MIPQSNPKAAFEAHRAPIEKALARVLESGWYILGEEVAAFESAFARAMGCAWSAGVASGTDAIEVALRALGVAPGDAVLTVSHTAVATAAAIARAGARPLFVDVERETYTMSPDSLRAALAQRGAAEAKAMVVVHLYGQPADMPALSAIASQHGLALVEDCAQAHGAALAGRPVGSWGQLACYSFYPTKNLGAIGDAGAITGNDPALLERVRLIREYGWRERYVSDVYGVNSRLDPLQAAVLNAKLPGLAADNERRSRWASEYDALLQSSPVRRPVRRANARHVFHQYVVECERRDALRAWLKDRGVGTLVHYPRAVHQQRAYAAPDLRPVPLPNTEALVSRILSLPMYPELTPAQLAGVAAEIRGWREP